MHLRRLYLILCVVGTALPISQLAPFVRQHGLDTGFFISQIFATPVSAFFGMDVIVSSVTLWVFVAVEGRRHRVPYAWTSIVANLLVGVSLGLPLFLYLRERSGSCRDRNPLKPGASPG